MRRRTITIPPGRYLIFYTFEDEAAAEQPEPAEPPLRPRDPEGEPPGSGGGGRV